MRVKLTVQAAITATLIAAPVGAGTVSALAAPTAARTVVYGFGGACPNGKWGKSLIKPAKAQFTGTKHQAATILLSQVRVHSGRKYFSHLVINWTTKGNKHHQEVYDWKHTNLGWMWI